METFVENKIATTTDVQEDAEKLWMEKFPFVQQSKTHRSHVEDSVVLFPNDSVNL